MLPWPDAPVGMASFRIDGPLVPCHVMLGWGRWSRDCSGLASPTRINKKRPHEEALFDGVSRGLFRDGALHPLAALGAAHQFKKLARVVPPGGVTEPAGRPPHTIRINKKAPAGALLLMAEGAGFEPARRLHAYTLSKRAPSATRPPLRYPVVTNGRTIVICQPRARPADTPFSCFSGMMRLLGSGPGNR